MQNLFSYKIIQLSVILTCLIPLFTSCQDEEKGEKGKENTQTIIMFFPWSGSDIYPYFINNIAAFEKAVRANKGTEGAKIRVFISSSKTEACLFDMSYNGGMCRRDTLRKYTITSSDLTTSSGIAGILNNIISSSRTEKYAMIIGCHGMGWLPKESAEYAAPIRRSYVKPYKMTRFYGHSSDTDYQTEISELSEGIEATSVKMDFLLFDDCYMSNIETAYQLRHATRYLIASTSEMMIAGIPYDKTAISLIRRDYQKLCNAFLNFYSNYQTPCGTLAVTDCEQVESMANTMKRINEEYPDGMSRTAGIQKLDGFYPTVFFDFGDYVANLCEDEKLLSVFNQQLDRLVPYKVHTSTYYSVFTDRQTKINAFSGLTISDPSQHKMAKPYMATTAWYKATH